MTKDGPILLVVAAVGCGAALAASAIHGEAGGHFERIRNLF